MVQPLIEADQIEFAPTIDGSNITNLDASNLASGTVPSGRLAGVDGSGLINLNASNLASGTVPSARLSGVDGSGLINLNASNLASGTVPAARIDGSTITNLNASNLASGTVPAARIDGSTITNLNASNLASGTVPSGRLSGTYNISISGNAASVTFRGALIRASATAVAVSTWTPVNLLGAVEYDTDGFFSAPDSFVIPAGISRVRLTAGGTITSVAASFQLIWAINKTIVSATAPGLPNLRLEHTTGQRDGGLSSAVVSVVPADVFYFTVFHTHGPGVSINTAGGATWFAIEVIE